MINCFKLVTGEDIIAEAKIEGVNGIVHISRPFQIAMMPTGPETFGVALIPFLPFAKTKEFRIRLDDVVMEFEPNDDIRNQYASLTSGLTIASPNDIPTSNGNGRPNLRLER